MCVSVLMSVFECVCVCVCVGGGGGGVFPRFLLSLYPLSRGDPCDQFWQ